ncbi:MAG: hypothetical protein R3F22_11255 [Lysobacteraceae bacterium]
MALGGFVLSALAALPVTAGDLTLPHSFSAGTPAVAAEVNANFDAVETAVDDNDARIAALEALVVSLQSQVAALQASNVMAIDPYVELTDITDPNDGSLYATVRITGANLQEVNGEELLPTEAPGLGNVIVGYNELSLEQPTCSRGSYDNEVDCLANGEVWSTDHRSGFHNLIVGTGNSYSRFGSLVAGYDNTANGVYSSVSGGLENVAAAQGSSISGGAGNVADGLGATVAGGLNNRASGSRAAVAGGSANVASGNYSVVSGGDGNTASTFYSSVTGGFSNVASGFHASVTGGRSNTSDDSYATVSGGNGRSTVNNDDWVAGSLIEDN